MKNLVDMITEAKNKVPFTDVQYFYCGAAQRSAIIFYKSLNECLDGLDRVVGGRTAEIVAKKIKALKENECFIIGVDYLPNDIDIWGRVKQIPLDNEYSKEYHSMRD